MDGSKAHLIVPKSVESFLEITLHPLSTCSNMCFQVLQTFRYPYVLDIHCRCQRGLCRGSSNSPSQHQGSPLSNAASNAESRLAVTYTKSKGSAPQPYNPRTLPPPELPPRAVSPSSTTSSSWHGAGQQSQRSNQETSPPRHNDQNVTNPLGRSHSAVMTSNIRMYFFIYHNKYFDIGILTFEARRK